MLEFLQLKLKMLEEQKPLDEIPDTIKNSFNGLQYPVASEVNDAVKMFQTFIEKYNCVDPDDDLKKFKSRSVETGDLKNFILEKQAVAQQYDKDSLFTSDLSPILLDYLQENIFSKILYAKSFQTSEMIQAQVESIMTNLLNPWKGEIT